MPGNFEYFLAIEKQELDADFIWIGNPRNRPRLASVSL